MIKNGSKDNCGVTPCNNIGTNFLYKLSCNDYPDYYYYLCQSHVLTLSSDWTLTLMEASHNCNPLCDTCKLDPKETVRF